MPQPMTAADFRAARASLAALWGVEITWSDMGWILRLGGRDLDQSIRDYERGTTKISGPLALALHGLLAGYVPAHVAAAGKRRPRRALAALADAGPPMQPQALAEARAALGVLWGRAAPIIPAEMARILCFAGQDPARMIARYESGAAMIRGPLAVAVELLLAGFVPDHASDGGAVRRRGRVPCRDAKA